MTPNPYRVPFDCLDKDQQDLAFRLYKLDSGDYCLWKEFLNGVASQIDWDSRTGRPWLAKRVEFAP